MERCTRTASPSSPRAEYPRESCTNCRSGRPDRASIWNGKASRYLWSSLADASSSQRSARPSLQDADERRRSPVAARPARIGGGAAVRPPNNQPAEQGDQKRDERVPGDAERDTCKEREPFATALRLLIHAAAADRAQVPGAPPIPHSGRRLRLDAQVWGVAGADIRLALGLEPRRRIGERARRCVSAPNPASFSGLAINSAAARYRFLPAQSTEPCCAACSAAANAADVERLEALGVLRVNGATGRLSRTTPAVS